MMIVQIHHTQYQVSLNVVIHVNIWVCAPFFTVIQLLIVWYPDILIFFLLLCSMFCYIIVAKQELNDLYSSTNIVRVIKSRRMRWAGHVALMGEERGGGV